MVKSYLSSLAVNVQLYTHSSFTTKLRADLGKCGVYPSLYDGHSFRNGRCTYSLQVRVNPTIMRQKGGWKSETSYYLSTCMHFAYFVCKIVNFASM